MAQPTCARCGAPMQAGLCPWDKGSGCIGRTLVYSQRSAPEKRPVPSTLAEVKTRAARVPRAFRNPRPAPLGTVHGLPKKEYQRLYSADRRKRVPMTAERREAHRLAVKAWRDGRSPEKKIADAEAHAQRERERRRQSA